MISPNRREWLRALLADRAAMLTLAVILVAIAAIWYILTADWIVRT